MRWVHALSYIYYVKQLSWQIEPVKPVVRWVKQANRYNVVIARNLTEVTTVTFILYKYLVTNITLIIMVVVSTTFTTMSRSFWSTSCCHSLLSCRRCIDCHRVVFHQKFRKVQKSSSTSIKSPDHQVNCHVKHSCQTVTCRRSHTLRYSVFIKLIVPLIC